jgi:nitrate/TMAO reductase-like tetraheme cytochrome c subunit
MNSPQAADKKSTLRILWIGFVNLLYSCNNPISLLGFFLVAGSFIIMVSFWLYSLTGPGVNRYLELIVFLILPGFFAMGLGIIPIGIFLSRRRARKRGTIARTKLKDVNVIQLKGIVGILLVLTMIAVIPMLSIASYHLYAFTESTRFCGTICHSAMKPQATAHARSAHARVSCAECHIGHGAGWFVKSKLSGVRQVYAVLADSFSRPIPPAITELRPARDTCEECHWPSRFFGRQYRELIHFGSTEDNRRTQVEIMLKIGGADENIGQAEGIHMHMLNSGPIEYRASDDQLQEIPWVRYQRTSGDVSIYRKKGVPADQQRNSVMRTVDCMDCHNRGAHHFRSPQISVDLEIEANRIDASLPYIKREAVALLIEPYPDADTALAEIEKRLLRFYQTRWPEVWAKQEAQVRLAVERIQSVYREDFFPKLKEDWRTYPENIGHQFSPGCFRCHDGQHMDDKGRIISSDCTLCHLFINPIDGAPGEFTFGRFQHPNSLSVHKKLQCHTCHGSGKRPRCDQCHDSDEWKKNRGKGQLLRTDEGEKEGFPPVDSKDAGVRENLFAPVESEIEI